MVRLIGFPNEMMEKVMLKIDDIIKKCDHTGKTPFNFMFDGVQYRSTLIIDSCGYKIVFDGQQFMEG